MSVIIRLQNLPWSANALDIRRFFHGLTIPDGGVHIIGGEQGDAFIAFASDEDARQAMMMDGGAINDVQIKLYLSSKTEMQNVIAAARGASTSSASVEPYHGQGLPNMAALSAAVAPLRQQMSLTPGYPERTGISPSQPGPPMYQHPGYGSVAPETAGQMAELEHGGGARGDLYQDHAMGHSGGPAASTPYSGAQPVPPHEPSASMPSSYPPPEPRPAYAPNAQATYRDWERHQSGLYPGGESIPFGQDNQDPASIGYGEKQQIPQPGAAYTPGQHYGLEDAQMHYGREMPFPPDVRHAAHQKPPNDPQYSRDQAAGQDHYLPRDRLGGADQHSGGDSLPTDQEFGNQRNFPQVAPFGRPGLLPATDHPARNRSHPSNSVSRDRSPLPDSSHTVKDRHLMSDQYRGTPPPSRHFSMERPTPDQHHSDRDRGRTPDKHTGLDRPQVPDRNLERDGQSAALHHGRDLPQPLGSHETDRPPPGPHGRDRPPPPSLHGRERPVSQGPHGRDRSPLPGNHGRGRPGPSDRHGSDRPMPFGPHGRDRPMAPGPYGRDRPFPTGPQERDKSMPQDPLGRDRSMPPGPPGRDRHMPLGPHGRDRPLPSGPHGRDRSMPTDPHERERPLPEEQSDRDKHSSSNLDVGPEQTFARERTPDGDQRYPRGAAMSVPRYGREAPPLLEAGFGRDRHQPPVDRFSKDDPTSEHQPDLPDQHHDNKRDRNQPQLKKDGPPSLLSWNPREGYSTEPRFGQSGHGPSRGDHTSEERRGRDMPPQTQFSRREHTERPDYNKEGSRLGREGERRVNYERRPLLPTPEQTSEQFASRHPFSDTFSSSLLSGSVDRHGQQKGKTEAPVTSGADVPTSSHAHLDEAHLPHGRADVPSPHHQSLGTPKPDTDSRGAPPTQPQGYGRQRPPSLFSDPAQVHGFPREPPVPLVHSRDVDSRQGPPPGRFPPDGPPREQPRERFPGPRNRPPVPSLLGDPQQLHGDFERDNPRIEGPKRDYGAPSDGFRRNGPPGIDGYGRRPDRPLLARPDMSGAFTATGSNVEPDLREPHDHEGYNEEESKPSGFEAGQRPERQPFGQEPRGFMGHRDGPRRGEQWQDEARGRRHRDQNQDRNGYPGHEGPMETSPSYVSHIGRQDDRKRGFSGQQFVYVYISNMPLSVSFREVRRFFNGIHIPPDGLKLINNSRGERNGTGYIQFVTETAGQAALKMNGEYMGDRVVKVQRCPEEEYNKAVDSYKPPREERNNQRNMDEKRQSIHGYRDRTDRDQRATSPKRMRLNSPAPRSHSPNRSNFREGDFCVVLKNLPFKIERNEFRDFFSPLQIPPSGVYVEYDNDGKTLPNSRAYVEFNSARDHKEALSYNKKKWHGSVIEVHQISRAEMEQRVQKHKDSQKSMPKSREFPENANDKAKDSPKSTPSRTFPNESPHRSHPRESPHRSQSGSEQSMPNRPQVANEQAVKASNSAETSKKQMPQTGKSDSTGKPDQTQEGTGVQTEAEKAVDVEKNVPQMKVPSNPVTEQAKAVSKPPLVATPPKQNDANRDFAGTEPLSLADQEKIRNATAVKLTGLPYYARDPDVAHFFRGLRIAPRGIHVLYSQGQAAGSAFVEFMSVQDCQRAVERDMQYIGKRYISVSPISKEEMLEEMRIAGPLRHPAAGPRGLGLTTGPRGPGSTTGPRVPLPLPRPVLDGMGDRRSRGLEGVGGPACVVGLQNIPYRATIDDILNFLKGFHPIPDSVRVHYNDRGQPTGDALVAFPSPEDAQKAIDALHRSQMMERTVNVYLA